MEKISKEQTKNKKQKVINRKSILNNYFSPILKLNLAVALLIIFTVAVMAEPVIIKAGNLNVSKDLLVNTNTFFVDSTNNLVGIGTISPTEKLEIIGNISADYFIGDGSLLTGISAGTTFNNENFTARYDARTDRFGLANYSTEYASTGYKKENLTLDYPNLDTDSTNDLNLAALDNDTIIRVGNVSWIISNEQNPTNATIEITESQISDLKDYQVEASGYKKENLTTDYPNLDTDGTNDQLEADAYKKENLTNDETFVDISGDTMTGAFTIDNDLTVDTNTLFVDSTNNNVGIGTTSPGATLDVVNTDSGASVPVLNLQGNSASPANDDQIIVNFSLSESTGGTKSEFGLMRLRAEDVTLSSKDSTFFFDTWAAGSRENLLQFGNNPSGNQRFFTVNEDSKDLDFKIESDTVDPAFFVEGSSGNVGIGTTTPTRKLHVLGDANVTGDLSYGTLSANSPHAFINFKVGTALKKTEICLVADDGVVVLQYLANVDGTYQWAFEPNAAECLNKEITTDIIIEYEEVFDAELNQTIKVEKSRTEVKKKVFQ